MSTAEPERKLNDCLEPRQRILQRKNQRIALRLEEEFWDQLEICAREEKRKLSNMLFDILENVEQNGNRAALIRVFCIRWLRQRLIQARQAAASSPDLQSVLSACPAPCVIMTAEKAIIAYNSAFAETIISGLAAKNCTKAKDGKKNENIPLTFRLATPLEAIYSKLLSGDVRYHDTKASFVQRDKTINAGARFCLIKSENSGNHPLLCFLTGV